MMENTILKGNRVDCLYRVSTDKQVDYNDKSQADIPMQRRECHRFCEKMGWTIVHEEQEDGVSGHKVRAENRDKLQIIKERAIRVRIVVDFPAPLGPIKPKTSPCSTVKLMFSIPRCFP